MAWHSVISGGVWQLMASSGGSNQRNSGGSAPASEKRKYRMAGVKQIIVFSGESVAAMQINNQAARNMARKRNGEANVAATQAMAAT